MKLPASTRPSITPVLTPAASARLDLVQIKPFFACLDRRGPAPASFATVCRRRNARHNAAPEAIEGPARAHHHAEHHARGRERVSRRPNRAKSSETGGSFGTSSIASTMAFGASRA